MKCAKVHPIFNDIRFFPFNGILILTDLNFNEIWDYSWFCSSDSIVELCVGALHFKVLIGSFLFKEPVRWKEEELQPKTKEVSGHKSASKRFVRKYWESLLLEAQVLNERSRKCYRTRSRQAILLALCFTWANIEYGPEKAWKMFRPKVLAEGLLKVWAKTPLLLFFFVLFVYKKTWL